MKSMSSEMTIINGGIEVAVVFMIRNGLGPKYFPKTITVGLEDIEPGTTDEEIKEMAVFEAESQLYNSEDYKHYRKNWYFKSIHQI